MTRRSRLACTFETRGRRPRENLAVTQQAYELGRLRVSDVLAEQRRFLELEREYTEVLRQAYEARTAVRLATGDLR